MSVDRARAEAAFDAFLAPYDPHDPKIALKAAHTRQVAATAGRIARDLGFPEGDQDLAWLLGLLHDLGRFEQVRRFGTFNDAVSASHARLSVELLRADGKALLRRFCPNPADDELILAAIGLHSAWRLPDSLDERTRTFCNLLRDADKIDILRVNCQEPVESIYGIDERELLESRLSDTARQGFYQHRTLQRSERSTPADMVVSHVCFVYELVYRPSLVLAHDQGFCYRMLERPFVDAQTREDVAQMAAHLRAWVAAQLAEKSR